MKMWKLEFKVLKKKGKARVGEITLNGITIQTPVFMPVGTKATIKGMVLDMLQDPKIIWEDLEPIRLILANTFHLYLRPWDELIKDAGGLHKFENWDKKWLILTDSGGFQVFSLGLGKKENKHIVPLMKGDWGGSKYIAYNPILRDKARELRNNPTNAEKKLRYDFLSTYKYKFLRQKPIDEYIVDFFSNTLKLIIEIDWDTHRSDKEVIYDRERTRKLESLWFQVIRFTNTEVYENFEELCNVIRKHKPPLSPLQRRTDRSISLQGGYNWEWHSVNIKLTEEGVKFNSPYDGSKHLFTPENVVDIQSNFWSDIMMMLDVCSPWDADEKTLYAQMQQTHRWAKRAYDHFMQKYDETKGVLFPIVQWGTNLEMRKESAEYLSQFATDGIAIWGVSVGESKEKVREVVEFTTPLLPEDKPRYLMWVGTPEDLAHAIEHGVDMFDCVLATRLGRHGVAFSDEWNIKLGNAKFKYDFSPLSDVCPFTQQYSKAYIHHLLREKEILWGVILSLHNIMYLHRMLEEWKKKILEE